MVNIGKKFSEITLENYPVSERVAEDKEPIVVRDSVNKPVGLMFGDGVTKIKNLAIMLGAAKESEKEIEEIAYADLLAKRDAGQLSRAVRYRLAYACKHRIEHTDDIHTEPVEPLDFEAVSETELAEFGRSVVYPDEIVKLDWTDTTIEPPQVTTGLDETGVDLTRTGRVVWREDLVRNIKAEYDYRGVTFRRWKVQGFKHALATYDAATNTFTAQITDNVLHENSRALTGEFILSALAVAATGEGVKTYTLTTVANHALVVGQEIGVHSRTLRATLACTVESVVNTKAVTVTLPDTHDISAEAVDSVYIVRPDEHAEMYVEIPNITYAANPFLRLEKTNGVVTVHPLKLYTGGGITTSNIKAKKLAVYFSKKYMTVVALDHTTGWNTLPFTEHYLSTTPHQEAYHFNYGALKSAGYRYGMPFNIIAEDFRDYKTFSDVNLAKNVQLFTRVDGNQGKHRYCNVVFLAGVENFYPSYTSSSTFTRKVNGFGRATHCCLVATTNTFTYEPAQENGNGLVAYQHFCKRDDNGNPVVRFTSASRVIMYGLGQFFMLSSSFTSDWDGGCLRAISTSNFQLSNLTVGSAQGAWVTGTFLRTAFDTHLQAVYFEFDTNIQYAKVSILPQRKVLSVQKSYSIIEMGEKVVL